MYKTSVHAVFRITLPHSGLGEIRSGHVLHGIAVPLPPRAAVVLDVGAGWWMRESEMARIAASLGRCGAVSIEGTDLRSGGADEDLEGVITGVCAIAATLARLLEARAPIDQT